MATNNDDLLANLNDFKLKNAKAMGDMAGDIRVLTTEVRSMNDTLISNSLLVATKKELEAEKIIATAKHAEQDERIAKLEEWNSWAVKIVLGLLIAAVIGTVTVTKVV
jgi:hypothetical protein